MKNVLFILAVAMAVLVSSSPAFAPELTTSYGSLKSCLGRLHFVSIANGLIYCSQTGTIYQDVNDLNNRGFLKTRLISAR